MRDQNVISDGGGPVQDYTIICGWHEMDVYHIRSSCPKTATFKAQCRAWAAARDAGTPGMGDVEIEHVAVVATFLGKMENLYPFPAE